MPQYKIKSGHGFPTDKQSEPKQIIFLKACGIRIILNLICIKVTLKNKQKNPYIHYKVNSPLQKEAQQVPSFYFVNWKMSASWFLWTTFGLLSWRQNSPWLLPPTLTHSEYLPLGALCVVISWKKCLSVRYCSYIIHVVIWSEAQLCIFSWFAL